MRAKGGTAAAPAASRQTCVLRTGTDSLMPPLAISRPALLYGAGFCAAQVMWESPADWVEKFFTEELEARVPREILSVKEVSREVNFSSVEKMVTLFVVMYSTYRMT